MSDYADNVFVTPDFIPAPVEAKKWEQGAPTDFSQSMRTQPTPKTPSSGGSGGGRPSIGLVFPH